MTREYCIARNLVGLAAVWTILLPGVCPASPRKKSAQPISRIPFTAHAVERAIRLAKGYNIFDGGKTAVVVNASRNVGGARVTLLRFDRARNAGFVPCFKARFDRAGKVSVTLRPPRPKVSARRIANDAQFCEALARTVRRRALKGVSVDCFETDGEVVNGQVELMIQMAVPPRYRYIIDAHTLYLWSPAYVCLNDSSEPQKPVKLRSVSDPSKSGELWGLKFDVSR